MKRRKQLYTESKERRKYLYQRRKRIKEHVYANQKGTPTSPVGGAG